jgi:DNA repair exonuclease SbcCD nuclease subunit
MQKKEISKIKLIPPKRNILMLHTSLEKKYLMDQYGEQLFPEDNINLLSQFDYIALGHWHNFQKVPNLDNAWYSGSTERMSDTEINNEKGICILEFEQNDKIIPKFFKIPTRNWFKLEITRCFEKTVDNILDEISSFIEPIDIKDSIFNLNLLDIKTEQSFEVSNSKIKKILSTVLYLNIKRRTHQEKNVFAQIESGSFDKLNLTMVKFIRSKYPNKEQSSALIEKSNYYFNLINQ